MSAEPVSAKQELRVAVRRNRLALSEDDRAAAASTLRARLDALVEAAAATSIGCYLPHLGEPDTRAFISGCRERGVRVLLPVSRADGLLDWVEASDAESAGLFGISEPTGPRLPPETAADLDLLLIPAAAVDVTGMRLGWGRGYYDRTIGSFHGRPLVFAVVYDSELVQAVPREPHDRAVDGVVTPTRTLRFAPALPPNP